VITEAGIFIGCLRLLPQGTFGWEQARISVSVLIVGLIMVITTWWLRNLFIAIPIGFGAVIYIGLLVLLRLLPQEDWQMLKHLGKDVLGKPGSTTSASRVAGLEGDNP
jgi:hypothetical protein